MKSFSLVYPHHITEFRFHDGRCMVEVWIHTPLASFLNSLYLLNKDTYESAKKRIEERSC